MDELFSEFLPRSRPSLDPLPGRLTLTASDVDRRWTIAPDWQLRPDGASAGAGAEVIGTAGDLALLAWNRALPIDKRFQINGDDAIVTAFAAAPVHP